MNTAVRTRRRRLERPPPLPWKSNPSKNYHWKSERDVPRTVKRGSGELSARFRYPRFGLNRDSVWAVPRRRAAKETRGGKNGNRASPPRTLSRAALQNPGPSSPATENNPVSDRAQPPCGQVSVPETDTAVRIRRPGGWLFSPKPARVRSVPHRFPIACAPLPARIVARAVRPDGLRDRGHSSPGAQRNAGMGTLFSQRPPK